MASRTSVADPEVPAARQSVTQPVRSRYGRSPRWLRALVIALASVYVLYLVAANVILRTHLLRGWLSSNPNALTFEYGSARSLLPGSVVLHDVRLRFQDGTIQMSVAIDRASVDIDLLSLTQHTASMRHVEAEGVVYRLRQKLETLDGNEGRAKRFPTIDGFPESPLAALQPKPVDGGGRSWTIEIRDVAATVRDVWTMEYRFRGDGALHGGFHIEPNTIAYVLPSRMDAHGGVLSLGNDELVKGGDWALAATIDPFSPRDTHGAAILKYLSFAVHEHGDVVGIAAVGDTYLPAGSSLAEGAGPVGIDVSVDHAIVLADSRVTYRTDRALFRAGKLAVASDLDVVTQVATEDGPRVVAEAKAKHGTMTPATELRDLHAELAFSGVDVREPIVIDRLVGALGSAHAQDLRAWNPVVKEADLSFTGGAATVSARGEYSRGALSGTVETRMEKLGLATGPFAVVCSGSSSAAVKSADLGKVITFPGARFDLHDVRVALLDGEADGMWVRARSNDAHVATDGSAATDATIAIESGPGVPTTQLFTRMGHLPDLAAEIVAGTQLAAVTHLRVRHQAITLDIEHAGTGVIHGAGRIHFRPQQRASGAFLIAAGPVSAGLDIHNGVSIVPLASEAWLLGTAAKR